MVFGADARIVPRSQLTPNRDSLDNYIQNRRYHGKPWLTDETDVFDILFVEDRLYNQQKLRDLSIQKWADR